MQQRMTPALIDIVDSLFSWAPACLSEDWDNVGLQTGDPFRPVSRAVISLDITQDVLSFALDVKGDVVISHHPLIFKPLSSIDLSDTNTRLLAGFLRHNISVISMHTNLDAAVGGVNDSLASIIGLENTYPLLPDDSDSRAGLGRVGSLKEGLTQDEFLGMISLSLNLPVFSFAGSVKGRIKKVAVCAGSGSSLFSLAVRHNVQAYVTSEIKHSIAREAAARDILVVDAGHFPTERPVVYEINKFLQKKSLENSWDLDSVVFEGEISPLRFWKRKR